MSIRLSRRDLIFQTSCGLGSVALSALQAGILSPKTPHHAVKAKSCIFLLMEGGPSHIDTFDPKPKLRELHMTEFVRKSKFASQMESGQRYYVHSPFEFTRAGKSGIEIATEFRHFAGCVDDICFYRGAKADSTNHPTALCQLNTGNQFGGDPAIGAWAAYGLGTINQNLPAFVVMPDLMYPQGGAANWSNGFLPAHYQGAALRPTGSPILDMTPPAGTTAADQAENLALLQQLNRQHQQRHPQHADLAARIDSYELAFRMQAEMPGVLAIDKESRRFVGCMV